MPFELGMDVSLMGREGSFREKACLSSGQHRIDILEFFYFYFMGFFLVFLRQDLPAAPAGLELAV